MSTTIELNELIGQHKDLIAEGVKKKLVENITQQIGWTAERKIQESVDKFITEEVAPVIQTYLMDNREFLIKQIIDSMNGIFAVLALKVTEKATKNLANEYKVRTILKEVFADF